MVQVDKMETSFIVHQALSTQPMGDLDVILKTVRQWAKKNFPKAVQPNRRRSLELSRKFN